MRDLEDTRKEKWELLVNVLGQCDNTMHYLCLLNEMGGFWKKKRILTLRGFGGILFVFVFVGICVTLLLYQGRNAG